VDSDDFGLSVYFTLNADGTLSGAGQTPSEPSEPTTLSGTWTLDSSGNLEMIFTDDDGSSRTLRGTLDFDADGDVVFVGSQTAGEPIQIGDGGQLYNISSFEMSKYEADLSNADLVGEWVAVSGIVFKNTDPDISENLLADGAGLTLIFSQDGTLEVRNTFAGGGQDNFLATYTIVDDFHLEVVVETDTQAIVFSLIDDVLTIYLYDSNFTFEGDSVDSPATQIFVLNRP
jgi:hypothetical protein